MWIYSRLSHPPHHDGPDLHDDSHSQNVRTGCFCCGWDAEFCYQCTYDNRQVRLARHSLSYVSVVEQYPQTYTTTRGLISVFKLPSDCTCTPAFALLTEAPSHLTQCNSDGVGHKVVDDGSVVPRHSGGSNEGTITRD